MEGEQQHGYNYTCSLCEEIKKIDPEKENTYYTSCDGCEGDTWAYGSLYCPECVADMETKFKFKSDPKYGFCDESDDCSISEFCPYCYCGNENKQTATGDD